MEATLASITYPPCSAIRISKIFRASDMIFNMKQPVADQLSYNVCSNVQNGKYNRSLKSRDSHIKMEWGFYASTPDAALLPRMLDSISGSN